MSGGPRETFLRYVLIVSHGAYPEQSITMEFEKNECYMKLVWAALVKGVDGYSYAKSVLREENARLQCECLPTTIMLPVSNSFLLPGWSGPLNEGNYADVDFLMSCHTCQLF